MSAIDTLRQALFGDPPVPNYKPSREGVLRAFEELTDQALLATFGIATYSTKAAMDAVTPGVGAPKIALVNDDPTPANNTIYTYRDAAWDEWTEFYTAIAAIVQPLVDEATDARDDAVIAAAIAVAAAASADYKVPRNADFENAIAAAVGGIEAVSILLDADEATYVFKVSLEAYDSAETITSVTPQIGPVMVANVRGAAYWPNLQAIKNADGLGLHDGIGFSGTEFIPDCGETCIDIVFSMQPVADTYASIAAMNAAIGTGDDVDLDALVYTANPGELMTTAAAGAYGQPLADTYLSLNHYGTELNQGYWRRQAGTYQNFARLSDYLFAGGSTISPGDRRLEMSIDNLGRIGGFVYYGSGGAQTGLNAPYRDVIAESAGELQHAQLHCRDGIATLVWNGVEVSGGATTIATTLNTLTMFGPIYLKSLIVTNGCDYAQNRALHDLIADRYGLPHLDWTDTVDLVINQDQSRTSASPGGTTGDANRPDALSNWNGETTARDGGDGIGAIDFKQSNPTHSPTPGLYSFANLTNSHNIGPFGLMHYVYGQGLGKTQSGTGTETIECGLWAQYRKHGGKNHLLIIGITIGGQTHAYLEQRSGKYLHSLPVENYANLQPRDWINRAVKNAQKWAAARGQRLRLICVADQQAETDVGTPGISATREADMRAWYSNELSHLVDVNDPPPVFMTKTASYSFDGFGNGSNTAGVYWRDDEQRRIGTHRDGIFRLRTLTSIYAHQGRFIHWTAFAQRKLGEAMGDIIGRAMFSGDDEALQPISAVRSGNNIIMTLNKPVSIVTTMYPTVLATITTGGFNTYGLVYTPVGGVKTINGNVTLGGAGALANRVLTIPISGGGPDAGDFIDVTGAGARWTNFKSTETRTGEYVDQDWPVSLPFASAAPTIDEGALNDITEWLAPSHFVLT
jgi:hypothetical protein